MITPKNPVDGGTSSVSSDYQFPNSRRIYVSGELRPDIRVPFREISQSPTKNLRGELEPNEPVRVYDTSGPWGDPAEPADAVQGLSPLRREWIRRRDDTEEYEGRAVSPIDDGYLSAAHAAHRNGSKKEELRIK